MENGLYAEYTLTAVHAAISSGNYLRQGFRTQMEISNKGEKHNLVTEYDIGSEKRIIGFIKEHYPTHNFLAEESGAHKEATGDIRWIIDPLDGTVNFAHGIPFFSVRIDVEKKKEVISGVVFQPMTQELFIAEKGKGAFFNGSRIVVTEKEKLADALLATGFPYNLSDNPGQCIEKFVEILKVGVPIRRMGVASLDLSYIACGRFDGFFEVSLGPWDCAAGKLIIEEAGGKVTSWDNTEFDIHSYQTILATNTLIHEELSKILSRKL